MHHRHAVEHSGGPGGGGSKSGHAKNCASERVPSGLSGVRPSRYHPQLLLFILQLAHSRGRLEFFPGLFGDIFPHHRRRSCSRGRGAVEWEAPLIRYSERQSLSTFASLSPCTASSTSPCASTIFSLRADLATSVQSRLCTELFVFHCCLIHPVSSCYTIYQVCLVRLLYASNFRASITSRTFCKLHRGLRRTFAFRCEELK